MLNLPFIDGIRKCDADNAIDLYISDDYEELFENDTWKRFFTEKPAPFTKEEKQNGIKRWIWLLSVRMHSSRLRIISKRAVKSGVKYIAQPGGSVKR